MEKPRLPRTAKKIQTKKMETQLGQLGLEIEPHEEVSIYSVVLSSLQTVTLQLNILSANTCLGICNSNCYYHYSMTS